jgi:hypothetical protein
MKKIILLFVVATLMSVNTKAGSDPKLPMGFKPKTTSGRLSEP